MMPNKPTTVPQLDTNRTNRTIPAPSKVTDGYVLNDILPASNLNYLAGWAGEWCGWLDSTFSDGASHVDDVSLTRSLHINRGPGTNALAHDMVGIELAASEMNSSTAYYTSAVKFMSTDSGLTTENPKLLGCIVGRAAEGYGSDVDGGLAIDFFTNPLNPGASAVPQHAMTLSQAQHAGIGTTTPAHRLSVYGGDGVDEYDNELIACFGSQVSNGEWTGIGLGTHTADIPKVALIHERTGNWGIGSLHLCVDAVQDSSSVSLADSRLTIDTAGRVGINSAPSTSSMLHVVNNMPSGNYEISIRNDPRWMNFRCDATNGSFSGLVDSGDHTLVFSDGTTDTGTLVIAPWNTGYYGFVMNADGTHGINKEPVDTYTAPKLAIGGGALGTTAGDEVDIFAAHMTVTNQDYLRLVGRRHTTDATPQWDTAEWRLQRQVATTKAGYIAWGHNAAGLLTFGEDNTEYMRLDGSGQLGIGATNPLTKLHVYAGASGQTPQAGTLATLEDDADVFMSFLTPAANEAGFWMGRVGDRDAGRFIYRHNDTLQGWQVWCEGLLVAKFDDEKRMYLGHGDDWAGAFSGSSPHANRQLLNLLGDTTSGPAGILFDCNTQSYTVATNIGGEFIITNESDSVKYFVAKPIAGQVQISDYGNGTRLGIGKAPAAADGVVQIDLTTDDLGILDASDTGGTASGYIQLKVGTATRYIRLETTA